VARTIMLYPVNSEAGATSVSLGLIKAMQDAGAKVTFMKPVAQPKSSDVGSEASTATIRTSTGLNLPEPIKASCMESMISGNREDVLLEDIIGKFEAHKAESQADIILVEGLAPQERHPYAVSLNAKIASGIDADIILLAKPQGDVEHLKNTIKITLNSLSEIQRSRVIGVIFNKITSDSDLKGLELTDVTKALAVIPLNRKLNVTRPSDLAKYLSAHFINVKILNTGDIRNRRLSDAVFCDCKAENVVDLLEEDALVVVSSDRTDVIREVEKEAVKGTKLGALILTGTAPLSADAETALASIYSTGLTVIRTENQAWQTAIDLKDFNNEIGIPSDDEDRVHAISDFIGSCFSKDMIRELIQDTPHERLYSPAAFRYKLTETARSDRKRIVLPEGNEPRTVKAAAICAERGIATPVLLGNPDDIRKVAADNGVTLGDGVEIIDVEQSRGKYVDRLVELRKTKGMTPEKAVQELQDNVMLGTMMIDNNEADGLVSGAVHTTANTIRPAFQIIKTAPGAKQVSSIFFMLLPDQVLVYGDCAVNPNPTAEELAGIAIQSADTAKAFGIEPRVAMISYSTGSSGKGPDVDLVKAATEAVKAQRPDLQVDGPLQYDAAVEMSVARTKAPNSPVAGKATVFIFPNLSCGNPLYKAVQRTAGLISIGPMLQGLKRPVNDLSRGALVDDIVYTIAITAIQAQQQKA